MHVESTPGRGATFMAYLPACEAEPVAEQAEPAAEPSPVGSETVLIAEDDDDVREIMVNTLRQEGYRVLPAENGARALDLCSKYDQQVDLLLTDVIMPGGISGGELARRLRSRVPSLKVLYTSGYAPGVAAADLNLIAGFNFLPKPHRPCELVRMVRDCLDQAVIDPEPTILAA
jgi:DNA-binding NtrC family response regulator